MASNGTTDAAHSGHGSSSAAHRPVGTEPGDIELASVVVTAENFQPDEPRQPRYWTTTKVSIVTLVVFAISIAAVLLVVITEVRASGHLGVASIVSISLVSAPALFIFVCVTPDILRVARAWKRRCA